jgi:serine/threonine protein kinase
MRTYSLDAYIPVDIAGAYEVHEERRPYRDIKLDNYLIEEDADDEDHRRVVLADFGLFEVGDAGTVLPPRRKRKFAYQR